MPTMAMNARSTSLAPSPIWLMPGIAHHALVRLVGEVGLAAEDLHRVVDDLPQCLGGPHLEHGGFEHVILEAAVDEAGTLARRRLHREGVGGHVGDLFLDQLELGQRLLELHALLGVRRRRRATQILAAPVQLAPKVVRPKSSTVRRDAQPLADLAEDVLGRHDHVLEGEPARGGAANAASWPCAPPPP